MTEVEAKEYINYFLALEKPTHLQIEKFKQALIIVSTIKMPK